LSLHLVTLADAAPQAWKNGGGITRDLLAWPSAAAWQLRISVAEVARSGPFSAYPGIQRWFAVVQGAGVVLHFADGSRTLTSDSPPLQFDGAAAPGCDLVDGPTLDLNLLADTSAGQARLQRVQPGVDWCDPAGLRALFTVQPAVLLVDGHAAIRLPAMSLAYTLLPAGTAWRTGGDSLAGPAWWLAFEAHTP
jgi:uncharacterized protein